MKHLVYPDLVQCSSAQERTQNLAEEGKLVDRKTLFVVEWIAESAGLAVIWKPVRKRRFAAAGIVDHVENTVVAARFEHLMEDTRRVAVIQAISKEKAQLAI